MTQIEPENAAAVFAAKQAAANILLESENATALIAMELADAAFHRRAAAYCYASARQVQAHAKDTYLAEGDEHADRFRVHYGNAIGYASRPEPRWRNDPPVYEAVTGA